MRRDSQVRKHVQDMLGESANIFWATMRCQKVIGMRLLLLNYDIRSSFITDFPLTKTLVAEDIVEMRIPMSPPLMRQAIQQLVSKACEFCIDCSAVSAAGRLTPVSWFAKDGRPIY